MKKRIKINGTIIFLCVAAIIIFPAAFLRREFTWFDYLAGLLGMLLLLCGALLRVISRGFKSEHSAGGNSLVIAGPYSMVRNPMYLGITCIAAGVIMLLFNWWVLLVFAVFFINRYLSLINKEEKILAERFGKQYIDYSKSVARLFPRLSMPLSKTCLKYLPLKFNWIKKELNSILIVIPGVLVIDLWEKFILSKTPLAMPYFLTLAGLICVFSIFVIFLAKNYERETRKN